MAREWTNDVRRRMSAIANGRLVAAAARAFVLAGAAFLMTSADAEAQPHAGSVFAAQVDVAGIAEPFIKL